MVKKIIPFNVAIKSTSPVRSFDRPKVYTNDLNSVEIQFKVTDCTAEELETATATTQLFMRDESFFQNPTTDVTRVGNVFSYTLKENEGNHDGLAEIQLVMIIGGTELASPLLEFEIISGLETKVAQEVMIYDWTTLTREARAYLDEFAANEILREAEFDNAQVDRTAAFNVAQTERTNQFNELAGELSATLEAADANIAEFDIALQNGIIGENIAAELQNLEETYAPDLFTVKQQLEQGQDSLRLSQNAPFNKSGAVLTFIDDDCRDTLKTTWIPLATSKGVKISVACLTSMVDAPTYMTKQELLDFQALGHDVLSHDTTGVDIGSQTAAVAEAHFAESQQWLKDNGFNGYDYVVYSGGLAKDNYTIKNAARKYYKYGVSAWLSGNPMYNSMPVDNWCIFRLKGETLDLATLKSSLDSAIANNGWVVVMTHSHLIDAAEQQKLSDFIDYANGLTVPILPFSEAVKYRGNSIANGEFLDETSTFVSVTGKAKVGANTGLTVNNLASANVMDALITTYKKDYVSVVILDSTKDNLTNVGGTMLVVRNANSDVYGYELFMPYNKNIIYKRMWRNGTQTWWPWEIIAGNVVKTTTERNSMSPVTAGLMVFDSTLSKPIWRNGANTSWVDATGTVV